MFWFPYTALAVNLLFIWRMPKRLTRTEIYATWCAVGLLNQSTDLILNLIFNLYDMGPPGPQLIVEAIEITLVPSYAVILLNFMPKRWSRFLWYAAAWVLYCTLFETVCVHLQFIRYFHWRLWYSMGVYAASIAFLRCHIRFLRRDRHPDEAFES